MLPRRPIMDTKRSTNTPKSKIEAKLLHSIRSQTVTRVAQVSPKATKKLTAA